MSTITTETKAAGAGIVSDDGNGLYTFADGTIMGGIIESGRNANGYYEYSSNGKLEQWGGPVLGGATTLNTGGAYYYYLGDSVQADFPVSFDSVEDIQLTGIYIPGGWSHVITVSLLQPLTHSVAHFHARTSCADDYPDNATGFTWHAVGKGTP